MRSKSFQEEQETILNAKWYNTPSVIRAELNQPADIAILPLALGYV
jgi:hypothetical protein